MLNISLSFTFYLYQIGVGSAMAAMPIQEGWYKKATVNGTFPEARLYPMMVGAFLLPVALFIFAFTGAYSWVNFMGMLYSMFSRPFLCSLLFLFI